jgi:hypothetical protein
MVILVWWMRLFSRAMRRRSVEMLALRKDGEMWWVFRPATGTA